MSAKVLICGSYAYDNIMLSNSKFELLPSMSFLVPTMRKEFGGCAGNIAYNLNLLGVRATPVATVGEDFTPYFQWIQKHNIDTTYIKVITGTSTGQAFIITDTDNNQITAFHPGAMDESHQNTINGIAGVDIGIVAPSGYKGMIKHADEFFVAKIPFIFDPGQGVSMFSDKELITFIRKATYVIVNNYEAQMLQDKTKLRLKDIADKVTALIITKGGNGSEIYTDGDIMQIKPAKAKAIKDPTGCGDAYRAGLIYGLINNLNWDAIGRLSGLLGAIKIAHLGTQNHSFDLASIKKLYQQNYHKPLF